MILFNKQFVFNLGTCPLNRTSNGIISEDERFVYKCCAPIHINLLSDDEDDDVTDVISNFEELQDERISSSNTTETPKIQKVKTRDISVQFPSLTNVQNIPARINSPDFSSDASSFIDNGARDAINRIIETPEENSYSDNESSVSHISLKGARIILKKLSEAEIKKYCSGDMKQSSSSNDAKKVLVVEKSKKDQSPTKDLSFSRAKFENMQKAKLIKRRISQFVDADSDNDDKESPIKQPIATNGVYNKIIERTKVSSRSSSESSSSRSKSRSSQKTHHRHSSSSSSRDKNRSKGDSQPSKKRKISEHESSKSAKDKVYKDREDVDKQNNEIRFNEKEPIPTTSKNVENTVKKFAFPTLNNNEKLNTVGKKITVRRHTTHTPNLKHMELIDSSEPLPSRRQSILIQELPRKDPETKRLDRMAKRLKSVGEKPASITVSEEIKKKLKDLAQKKLTNLPEKEAVEISLPAVTTKATTSKAPMKVRKNYSFF